MTHAVWRQQEYTYCNLLAAQHFPSYKRNCSKQRVLVLLCLLTESVLVTHMLAYTVPVPYYTAIIPESLLLIQSLFEQLREPCQRE